MLEENLKKMTILCRFYHVSPALYSVRKQGIKLCKLINPENKKQWYQSHTSKNDLLPSVKSLAKVKHEPGKRSIRRLAMLNKLFMKQITDIMSTGTVAMDVVGRGIEISKAKVTPDMQAVNVYWVCKGTSTDQETEAVLNRIAGPLRHELSTLRVMGEVPYITFVKDLQESHVAELDRRLAAADYGEDYTPTDAGQIIKDEFTLHTKLSPEMKAKIKQLEDESPLLEEPIPEMTHNIYGLEHARFMNRMLAARKKSKDAWTNLEADNTVISYRAPDRTEPEPDVVEQRQQLADFLLKRQILQNKLNKQLRDSRNEWQLAPDNTDEDSVPYGEEDDDEYSDDDDYYDNIRFQPENTQQKPQV